MIKHFCDKCGEEKELTDLTNYGKAICESEDRSYVISTIQLCDKCRKELGEIIRGWLFSTRKPKKKTVAYGLSDDDEKWDKFK